MQKPIRLFERVPLQEVPRTSKAQKKAARPKRTIRTDADDHPVGLWINTKLLRKHQNRTPQVVLHDPSSNRYLTLADLAFKNHKQTQKGK